MSKPYNPQPGTIPARVIAHLESLPPGTFVSTAELSELLDIQLYSVASSLAHPRSLGAVVSRHTASNRRALEWALGDGTTPATNADDEPEEPLLTKAGQLRTRGPLPPPQLLRMPAAPPLAQWRDDLKPSEREASDHFRAGIFTDGSMRIEHGNTAITLNPTQAAQVARLTNQGIQP